MRTFLSASAAWILLASVADAGDTPAASFAKKPKVTKTAEGGTIEFAVSAPTDVAVFIEDGSGKVVRHLVAGVLARIRRPR